MGNVYETKIDTLRVFYDNLKWSYQNTKIRENMKDMPNYNMRIDKSHPYDPKEDFDNFVCIEKGTNPLTETCGINFGKNKVGLAQHIGMFHDL